MFVKKAPSAKMFKVPGAYHELLFENEKILNGVLQVITDFFSQETDDMSKVQAAYPLESHDPKTPIFSLPEIIIRGTGVIIAAVGMVVGLAMVLGDRKYR